MFQQRDTEIADLKAQVKKHKKEITDSQEKVFFLPSVLDRLSLSKATF